MAKVIIGGTEFEGDLDTFAKLEASWPYMAAAQSAAASMSAGVGSDNPFTTLVPMLEILAISIGKDLAFIKSTMKFKTELPGIVAYFTDLLADSLVTRPAGEPAPPAAVAPAASPSTETSTESSPS
jgi:hypothetical protein